MQYLLESGWSGGGRLVGVTQPRRVAVVTVAGRVAEERGAVLGHEVGYAIRFDEQWDRTDTKLKFLTDGMLIREMMRDPLLTKYRYTPQHCDGTPYSTVMVHPTAL